MRICRAKTRRVFKNDGMKFVAADSKSGAEQYWEGGNSGSSDRSVRQSSLRTFQAEGEFLSRTQCRTPNKESRMLNFLFGHVPDFLIGNSLFDIRCSPTVHRAFGNKLVAKNNQVSTLLGERY